MNTTLERRALKAIRDSRMMAAGDRIGVAVSGGADSVALLRLLEKLRNELGVTLAIVHFDHSLRGAASRSDAEFVAELANEGAFEFFLAKEDVGAAARQNRWNLEDAARRLRYGFFQRLVKEGSATRIAVAHTSDDQAETVLAHVLRGTGPPGLAGIYPIAGPVVRPLLELRRYELREYLHALGQSWREDATNLDQSRQRARIRKQLLPLLERDFSPDAVDHLSGLAQLAREEQYFWDALVEDRFRAFNLPTADGILVRICDLLAPLDLPSNGEAIIGRGKDAHLRVLTERLIRRLYEEVRGHHRDLGAFHVRKVIQLATSSISGRRIELPGKVLVERNFDTLGFSLKSAASVAMARETKTGPTTYHYAVPLAGRCATSVTVPELGSRFYLKVVDWPILERDTKSVAVALDADLIQDPVFLRSWRPGDSYRPLGHFQAKKLKKLLAQARVPARQRPGWPVIESQGRVVWARSMPAAHDFCAKPSSRVGLLIEEERL